MYSLNFAPLQKEKEKENMHTQSHRESLSYRPRAINHSTPNRMSTKKYTQHKLREKNLPTNSAVKILRSPINFLYCLQGTSITEAQLN